VNIKICDVDFHNESIRIEGIKREDSRLVYPRKKAMKSIGILLDLHDYKSLDSNLFNINRQTASEIISKATGKRYSPKDFRTTFGTEVAKKTNNPYLVQKLMGHKKISSSLPYIHLGQPYGEIIKDVEFYDD
jgi:integrase